ncbi:MAG: bifunctional metallophosphatase/5'-nucleotidase [Ignavibacteria bacterium]|nr:bifunctional metallophosphatase/5'-nucleotidase [Ignavibacteria bacterium]
MKILLIVITAIFAFNTYAQDLKEVTILHYNDFHARNQPFKVSKKDSATGEQVYYWVGGVGGLSGYINKYRTANSLLLNAGDDFQGTPISNFTRGRSQIEIMNSLNLDAFVLGNHEFDYSQYSLDSALALANFDYLSCNVYMQSQNKLMGKPYIMKDINGVRFGIIGLTLPELFTTSLPANVTDLVMLNADSVLTVNINEVKSKGADIVVVLSHSGIETDKMIAEKFYADVDIIVGGHSHTTLFKPIRKNGVIIVQAGSHGRNLGKLDLKIDTEKDTLSEAYGVLIETVLDSAVYDKDAAVKVDNMIAEYLPELSVKIGTLETDWRASYGDESNLGQFEADAFRMKTGADIGFVNGGGLRKSLLKGDILVGDIWEINPFGNEIQTITVSGKTLKQMLKNNIKIRLEKISKGEGAELLHNSGLTYSYDSRKANEGSDDFIVSMNIGREEVTDDRMYTIATNNYVLGQFKKFFGDIPETITTKDTGWNDRDLIIEVVKELKVINSVVEKRVVDVSKQ